jgi:hypothetical protein
MEASISLGEFWKFLLLRLPSYEAMRRAPNSLWIGLRLFVVAGLVASIGVLTTGLAEASQTTLAEQLSGAASSLDQAAECPVLAWTPRLASAITTTADRLRGAAAAVQAVQPPLGTSVSMSLRAVGAWLSQPLFSLTAWMIMFLPLILAARLMGGRGSIREQVSLGLLAFMPQALTFLSSFSPEPGTAAANVAMILRVVAVVWGLVIWVTASAIANGYNRGRAAQVLLVTVIALAAMAVVAGWLLDRLAGPLLTLLL